MAKYKVWCRVVGSKYLGEFEANSEDEAEEIAIKEAGHISLCHQCANECEEAQIDDVDVELAETE